MPQYDESFLDSPIFRRRTRSYAVQKEFVPKSRSFITATPLLLAVTNHARTLSGSISTCSLKGNAYSSGIWRTPKTISQKVEERSGGKARGGKLARRARSFKEDFLEKLSQMRSPGSGSGGGGSGAATRAASPSSPRTPRDKNAPVCTTDTATAALDKNPIRDLHIHVRQVQLALLHFRDVVWKKKLEMLPGNGTIVLDTVTTIQSVLKSYLLYENSSALGSATDLVYQTLAQLLQLCDEVLLQGDQSPALDTEHVTHVIRVVEEAVKNLVALANEKIANRQKPAAVAANNRTSGYGSELTPQRNSLPDIPLTPRERQILEQTAATTSLVRSSHSSESILRDSSPPPKPPLPERTNVCLSEENSSSGTPPPLPPKRRTRAQQLLEESEGLLASSLDRVSLRSRSPEDSSSLLSASAGSLDSALNHSRDEDEIRAIMGPNDESLNDSMDLSLMATIQGMQVNGTSNCSCWDGSESSIPSTMLLGQQTPQEMLNAFTVMAYMEMFGNCSHSNNDFISGLGTRHSVAAYNSMQAEWQKHEMALTTTQSCSFMAHTMATLHDNSNTSITMTPPVAEITNNSSLPPALPPKRSRSIKSNATPPPISPKPTVSMQSIHTIEPVVTSTPVKTEETVSTHEKKELAPSTPVKSNNITLETILPSSRPASNALSSISVDENTLELRDVDQDKYSSSILEELDVTKYLVFKKPDEEGPDIRGGHPDALLIHATKANKHDEKESDFLYQEAFLTTYRTFMQPLELIQKLHKRHQSFSRSADVAEQRTAREAFALLVRVVSDLTISDLDDTLLQTLMEYVLQLVCNGDLTMAKALRVKILEKHQAKQLQSAQPILSSLSVSTKQASLLDFKSEQIAEQMTLLDADLFMKIEIPEVLIWAQEQNEERSPNLTRFTEHFNKMSYWARSRILEHRLENEAKDREKYVVKFIKIMKHLRKINNFNSYLALLSALDSAPIRRLEWQKHITEGLKEYCALIDSSSSFRAYRQALAETQPPCIPYIGLVLQDLTFVHIGNSDLLPDGTINFSKRWQQFNIVENMKRFKKGRYSFKKHERIITFFNNFSDFLCEEAMWQISESIKPRGGKKAQSQN
ncbi:C3G guanyl-nucleotide exchange factor isoform X10 [Lasioglossum baleicum]|uniref:C3G guanyl-nucleotide exchange factor isoform X10 n=1 Tax=Lasioglossum baleicum TaxID=434251 RepID=UPI003FCED9F0